VSIVPIFQTTPLDPEALDSATRGYNIAREDLGLVDHVDPITEVLAEKIVEVVLTGERDPETVANRAIDSLGATLVPKPKDDSF
jgi:hypothetical protein